MYIYIYDVDRERERDRDIMCIYIYTYRHMYLYFTRAKIRPVALAPVAWLFETTEPEGDAKRLGSPQLDLEMVYIMIYHGITV